MVIADNTTSRPVPLQVEHRRDTLGWCFEASGVPPLQGGGESLTASVETAGHSFRRLLSQWSGREVSLSEAQSLLHHVHHDFDPPTRRDSR